MTEMPPVPFSAFSLRRRWLALLGAAVLAGCAVAPTAVEPKAAPAPVAVAPVTPVTPKRPAAVPGSFADSPIVYFVVTDRFANGNPANDAAYGRQREKDPAADVGTFHGGDLKGLTGKIKEGWFKSLGVNAIWITAPYEQIHGWVVGGNKAFKHYAYHGYYALDYTVLDQAMGTPEELRELVDSAHANGIRILFDVVMNHPGYLDIQTAVDLNIPVLWPRALERATLQNYHRQIDYNNFEFRQWWGRPWVRAGLPGYLEGGRDDLTSQLAYLPDFRTESTEPVTLPTFLKNKPGTRAVDLPNTTVRGYLVKWLTDWVREYGIDGFRVDTVKHVEPEAWTELKREATKALAEWKAKNPTKKIDDAPFWMTGEYWGHGPERGRLHAAGFDNMINFDFQERADQLVKDGAQPDALFEQYARLQAGQPAQMLNYISSHDTKLFDRQRLIEAGSVLLLAPGGVQIYYGDETARPNGPVPSSDPQQATRSDMNWANPDAAVLAHWRRLGSFRARHVALARGEHERLGSAPYTFARQDRASGDRVVVALNVAAGARVPVGRAFADGDRLRDAYSGHSLTVSAGQVTVDAAAPAVLLEAAP
jgi:alpha-amylase